MQQTSRPVRSRQIGVHARLQQTLDARRRGSWRAPLHAPSLAAFEAAERMLGQVEKPRGGLVLDSGCGTGESTRCIARALPDCLVIGIDKSEARLARTGAARFPHRERNAVLLRADLTTFWRLAADAGWRLRAHFLLYPNPWPKPAHLRRRWHAHPAFPALLALGGRLEMRCNWKVYAEEFAAALGALAGGAAEARPLGPETSITSPFERKYRASGHDLYSVVLSLDSTAVKWSTPVRLL